MNVKKIAMMLSAVVLAVNVQAANVKFKVSNMNGEDSAKRVEMTLKANDAVSKVKVNLEGQAVCVSYDEKKTSVEVIRKALSDAKFQVEILKQCNKEGGCKHDGKEEKHGCGGDCKKSE
jgi:copper chaperone CopZ